PDTSHFFRYLAYCLLLLSLSFFPLSCFFRYLSFPLSCFLLLLDIIIVTKFFRGGLCASNTNRRYPVG
ncbi:MAG: hypothetical protein AB1765_06870, partial [Candidatus Hydrogenedentota bacterium]